jgi:hypothetical protein
MGRDFQKSTRHSKITGDFAERLILYWLSKQGFECAYVDHTGIDIIARIPNSEEAIGISVKSRSRYSGTEHTSINVPTDNFAKAEAACKAFHCTPYFAFVVDGGQMIRGFLLPMKHFQEYYNKGRAKEAMHYWQMNAELVEQCRKDADVRCFQLNWYLDSLQSANEGQKQSAPRISDRQ